MRFTMRMSNNYRVYDDRWRNEPTKRDQPVDVSEAFRAAEQIMDDIAEMLVLRKASHDDMEKVVLDEMVQAVFGSNMISRVKLGYDETLRICLAIFRGESGVE